MANNLVESIQANLGLPALQKVDPNIQEAKDKNSISSGAKLAQAAIPTVATGIYRLTRTDEGCAKVQGSQVSDSWLEIIFDAKTADVVEKVARYANVPRADAEPLMEKIAVEAIGVIRKEQAGPAGDTVSLREYMSQQRHNILVYLPAAMQIGDLLNDNSMDDRTNKMEGPISNLMHKIENTMARGES
ncbi:MAG: hypothetical protein EOO09_15425 [Chitinophagaceae bacterium]|nr:MAG: hypothetical protein EOO09_15425 [Chitinophagaceae bacterium]